MSGPDPGPLRNLNGWANTAPTPARVLAPSDPDAMADLLAIPAPRGIIARGLGRSYGDPAQNAGGLVIDTTSMSTIRSFDRAAGIVTVDAGASLDALMQHVVAHGWFVPVTPGTRQVTVGGAIAADVHGKNHHKVGSWCSSVESITIVTPAGGRERIGPDNNAELFWATAGGMGLTGLILDATIRLTPIETAFLTVDTDRTQDLDATLSLMESGDDDYDYSVAWIDLMATGAATGRCILDRGRFAPRSRLTGRDAHDAFRFRGGKAMPFPPIPMNLITPATARLFNEAWYRKAPRRRRDALQTIGQYFHPLDLVDRWNRVYGPTGLLQWQCCLPLAATEDLRWIVERLSTSGRPSFLSVLKRFGPGNLGPLSFPLEGWTLAVDVPASRDRALGALLDDLDERVAAVNGRLYLAKDSRLRPELLADMYPRLDDWRDVRERADPHHRLNSDLARRLDLLG